MSVISIDITSPGTVDSLRRELRVRDLECIRLRHALREACDGWEHLWRSENNDEPPAGIAELRKLVQP